MAQVNHKPLDKLNAKWLEFDRPQAGAVFRHYKGGLYEIVATGFLEATEEPAIIYRSLKYETVWVRTAANFFEKVQVDGHAQPRFEEYNR